MPPSIYQSPLSCWAVPCIRLPIGSKDSLPARRCPGRTDVDRREDVERLPMRKLRWETSATGLAGSIDRDRLMASRAPCAGVLWRRRRKAQALRHGIRMTHEPTNEGVHPSMHPCRHLSAAVGCTIAEASAAPAGRPCISAHFSRDGAEQSSRRGQRSYSRRVQHGDRIAGQGQGRSTGVRAKCCDVGPSRLQALTEDPGGTRRSTPVLPGQHLPSDPQASHGFASPDPSFLSPHTSSQPCCHPHEAQEKHAANRLGAPH